MHTDQPQPWLMKTLSNFSVWWPCCLMITWLMSSLVSSVSSQNCRTSPLEETYWALLLRIFLILAGRELNSTFNSIFNLHPHVTTALIIWRYNSSIPSIDTIFFLPIQHFLIHNRSYCKAIFKSLRVMGRRKRLSLARKMRGRPCQKGLQLTKKSSTKRRKRSV